MWKSLCYILFVTNYVISCFFINPASAVDRTPGASSLQCLSSIVDRLSSVDTGVAVGMRNMVALSPTGSDSQCSSADSPSNRPVYHVLWEGARHSSLVICFHRTLCRILSFTLHVHLWIILDNLIMHSDNNKNVVIANLHSAQRQRFASKSWLNAKQIFTICVGLVIIWFMCSCFMWSWLKKAILSIKNTSMYRQRIFLPFWLTVRLTYIETGFIYQ